MRPNPLALLAFVVGVLAAPAVGSSPVLVELFTSEGCSSCPPAEAYLDELTKSPQARAGEVVFIAWHVDYWDHLGWKEPFGLAFATQRQRDYAETMKAGGVEGAGVYTPQMVVNGRRAFVGSEEKTGRREIGLARRADTAALEVGVTSDDGSVTATAELPDLPDGATVVGVLVEDGLRSEVTAGENKGKTLTHERVARAVARASVEGGAATVRLDVPEGVKADKASVVLFVQGPESGPILAVGTAPVASSAAAEAAPAERYQTLKIGRREMRYALILPDGFDASKAYPVVLALPPGAQDQSMVEAGLGLYWEKEAKKRGWVVVSPINPDFARLFQSRLDPLGRLMDDLGGRFKVEGGKFHLAGVSNGGRAAFIEALKDPERFASLTVLPGVMDPSTPEEEAKKLAGIPVAMYVGGDDTQWAREAQRTLEKLKAQGVNATLTVREGEGHVISLPPKDLFDLLDSRRR